MTYERTAYAASISSFLPAPRHRPSKRARFHDAQILMRITMPAFRHLLFTVNTRDIGHMLSLEIAAALTFVAAGDHAQRLSGHIAALYRFALVRWVLLLVIRFKTKALPNR
jgi:hypothetical protein